MPFINPNGEVICSVATGEHLAVCAHNGGYCNIYVKVGDLDRDLYDFVQRVSCDQVSLDAVETDTTYKLEASSSGFIEYACGTHTCFTEEHINAAKGLIGLDFTDKSGTPGDATINTPRGRAAIDTLASTVTITSSLVKTTSTVLVTLIVTDETLKYITAVPGNGSFVVTGNAATTLPGVFDFLVVN